MARGHTFSTRSNKRLEGVHCDLVSVTRLALHYSEVDFGITQGLRTLAEQRKLYAAGKSKTMNSRHLTGHAVDVVAWVGGNISWDEKHYHKIADAFKQASRDLDIPIEWGGDWKSFFDGPHFQLPWDEYPKDK